MQTGSVTLPLNAKAQNLLLCVLYMVPATFCMGTRTTQPRRLVLAEPSVNTLLDHQILDLVVLVRTVNNYKVVVAAQGLTRTRLTTRLQLVGSPDI